MQALAASPHLGRLRVLNLYNNNLGPSGVSALVSAGWWSQLVYLNLTNNGLGDAGAEALAAAATTGQLRSSSWDATASPIGARTHSCWLTFSAAGLRDAEHGSERASPPPAAASCAPPHSCPWLSELNLTGNPGVR